MVVVVVLVFWGGEMGRGGQGLRIGGWWEGLIDVGVGNGGGDGME